MRHMDEGRLQAWLDGPRAGLSPEERAAVEEHLAACGECVARVEALRREGDRAGALLASMDEPEEIPDFQAVVARAGELGGGERRPRRRLVAMGWAASVMVALGAGWIWNEMTSGGRTPPDLPSSQSVLPEPQASDARAPAGLVESMEGSDTLRLLRAQAESVDVTADVVPPPAPVAELLESTENVSRIDAADTPPTGELFDAARTAPVAREEQPRPAQEARRRVEAESAARVAVRGRVFDGASGRPLESAQVYVAETGEGALTNREGEFQILLPPSVDSSAVTLIAQMIGYTSERRDLAFSGVDSIGADFEMSATALELSAVAVTAGRAAGEASSVAAVSPVVRLPSGWTAVSRSEAEDFMGAPIRTVPWLEIVTIEIQRLGDTPVARVEHALREGRRLTLLQAYETFDVPDPDGGVAQVDTLLQDGLFVVGRAPLPADSIRTLLGQVR